MNTIREIQKINEEELRLGIAGTKASWHEKYSHSAWVYVGNLDNQLTEGDVLAVLSQYGEIEDLHLVRDEETGVSKGFAFCKYEDARSCILAVDNLCGATVCGRSLRVDHVENYRLPKHLAEKEREEEEGKASAAGAAGHAYEGKELASEFTLQKGQDLFSTADDKPPKEEPAEQGKKRKKEDDHAAEKEAKKQRKEERRRRREEKEQRKREREEKRRERRARKLQREQDDPEQRRRRKHHKKKHKHEKRESSDE